MTVRTIRAACSVRTGFWVYIPHIGVRHPEDAMPYAKQAEAVLAAWRAVERELAKLDRDLPDAKLLEIEAARLREEYAALTEAARDAHRPEPPPWPVGS